MSLSFHFDLLADIDDHLPARRHPSAFRRCRELMPRDARPHGAADATATRAAESRDPGMEHRNACARPERTSAH